MPRRHFAKGWQNRYYSVKNNGKLRHVPVLFKRLEMNIGQSIFQYFALTEEDKNE